MLALVLSACSNAASTSPSGASPSGASPSGASPSGASPSGASPSGASPSEAGTGGSNISLRVVIFSANPNHLKLLNGLADSFKALHPNVTNITFETVPGDQELTVLSTQVTAGTPPDISWLSEINSQYFINAGVLYDIAPTIKADPAFNYADLIQQDLAIWLRGDAQYGMPFSTSTIGMYYNADLFTQAGLPTPDQMIAQGTWDWDHFRSAVAKIAQTPGVFGYNANGFDYSDWTQLSPLWYAYGAAPWDTSGKTCTMASPQMTQAMQLFHDMVFKDHSSPQPGETADFWGGKAAATSAFISSSALLEKVTFKWGFVPMPAGPAGAVPTLFQSAFVVYKQSPNAQVAADFVDFMTNQENSKQLAQFFPPARTSSLSAATLHAQRPLLSEQQLQAVVVTGLKSGTMSPVHPNAGAITPVMNSALKQYVFQPNADVSSGLQQICAQLQPLLNAGQ
jgi:multiple sugar transport system substrate-binding protein